MKSTTSEARAMSDEQLRSTAAHLNRTLPRMHSLQDAVKRGLNRRARNWQKAEKAAQKVEFA